MAKYGKFISNPSNIDFAKFLKPYNGKGGASYPTFWGLTDSPKYIIKIAYFTFYFPTKEKANQFIHFANEKQPTTPQDLEKVELSFMKKLKS